MATNMFYLGLHFRKNRLNLESLFEKRIFQFGFMVTTQAMSYLKWGKLIEIPKYTNIY